MAEDFVIDVNWLAGDHGDEEVRQTSALVSVSVNGRIATNSQDDWSRTVSATVRLSAYPLAMWIAQSWWRLLWEPPPPGRDRPLDWRQAHELPAAGYGFLWPPLVIEPDGEGVVIKCHPTPGPTMAKPVHYLERFTETVSAATFEKGLDRFVTLVLKRLAAVGLTETDLHALWNEIAEERRDRSTTANRKLEARLGFDPDAGPPLLIAHLKRLEVEAGADSVQEIASACVGAGTDPNETLKRIVAWSGSPGVSGTIEPVPPTVRSAADARSQPAWQRGREMARSLRSAVGIGADQPVTDLDLAGLLGISDHVFGDSGPANGPLGLAVRYSDKLHYHFRRNNRPGRRFEAARFLGDHLAAAEADRWLPAADTGTARQKMQRAFAAELLCPIGSLKGFLGGDLGEAKIEDAGDHFGVSPLAIRSHLANHGLLPAEAVAV